jgi:hypothetical protein
MVGVKEERAFHRDVDQQPCPTSVTELCVLHVCHTLAPNSEGPLKEDTTNTVQCIDWCELKLKPHRPLLSLPTVRADKRNASSHQPKILRQVPIPLPLLRIVEAWTLKGRSFERDNRDRTGPGRYTSTVQ